MSSQSRINAYMERHRLGPLFEDLMNKVLRDMPEEPMVYLIRTMYKKAGMEIPQGIRYGGLRKSTDLSRSPERPVRSAHVSSSTDANGMSGSRDYSRPWAASPTRKMKVRKSEDLSASSKQKPEWNSDVKMKTSPFDELWDTKEGVAGATGKEKTVGGRKSPTKQLSSSTPASAWASVGVLDANEMYTSPAFSRPHGNRSSIISEKELLASETLRPSLRTESNLEPSSSALASNSTRGRRLNAQKHRQEMARALKEVDRNSDDSGVGQELVGSEDPDAIELLEDADDLQREGVRNIPRSGYKLSKAMRYRKNEPRVKLSLNLNPTRASSVIQWQDSSSMFDYNNGSLQSSPEQAISDEEFESVSQVSGPRQPVWKVPDVDRDFPSSRPSYSKQVPLTSNTHRKNFTEQTLSMTSPDPFKTQTEDLDTYKSWTAGNPARVSFEDQASSRAMSSRSIQSETDSGGWMLPEDTEVASALDWNQRVKGSKRQDPRSY